MDKDPFEREAERIADSFKERYCREKHSKCPMSEDIKSEIAQALRTAVEADRNTRCAADLYKHCYEKGFSAGIEASAHHCEDFDYKTGWVLSDEIRSLQPSEKTCYTGLIDCHIKGLHNHDENSSEKTGG